MRVFRQINFLVSIIGLATLGFGICYPVLYQSLETGSLPLLIQSERKQARIPKKFSEAAWGKVGKNAYQAAAQVMASNNTGGQPLDEIQKYYLRPHFGNLVDEVTVVYNARLMDEIVAASFRIDVGKSNAQVYGNKIYVSAEYKPGDIEQLILLAHEMVHVKQYKELGSLEKFGYNYFKEYKRAGQNYRANKMEREAFEFERKFANWLYEELAKKTVKPQKELK